MRFYRVHDYSPFEGSGGFEFFTSKAEALKRALELYDPERHGDDKSTIDIEVVDVTPTKNGILSALNVWASHPDNG